MSFFFALLHTFTGDFKAVLNKTNFLVKISLVSLGSKLGFKTGSLHIILKLSHAYRAETILSLILELGTYSPGNSAHT